MGYFPVSRAQSEQAGTLGRRNTADCIDNGFTFGANRGQNFDIVAIAFPPVPVSNEP